MWVCRTVPPKFHVFSWTPEDCRGLAIMGPCSLVCLLILLAGLHLNPSGFSTSQRLCAHEWWVSSHSSGVLRRPLLHPTATPDPLRRDCGHILTMPNQSMSSERDRNKEEGAKDMEGLDRRHNRELVETDWAEERKWQPLSCRWGSKQERCCRND